MESKLFLVFCMLIQALYANKDNFEEQRLLNITQTLAHSDIEILPYGVYLKKVDMIDLAASTWNHVFRIPRLPSPPTRQLRKLCNAIPHADEVRKFFQKAIQTHHVPLYFFNFEVFNRTRHMFCSSLEQLSNTYATLLNYTQERNADLYLNMISLITNRIDETSMFPVVNWTAPDVSVRNEYLDLEVTNATRK